jgi:hypothetical protein
MIIFGSVFIKKNNQTEIFLKKPKLGQTDLARFFPVLDRFFRFGSGFFRFGFFGFLLIKPKPNRLVF